MDFRRHVTAGRLSELFGADQVDTDTFIRTLGWRRVAEQEVDAAAPGHPALPAGLRRRRQRVPDRPPRRAASASSTRCSACRTRLPARSSGRRSTRSSWLKAMAWDLRGNIEDEIDRGRCSAGPTPAQQIDQLYPAYPYDRPPRRSCPTADLGERPARRDAPRPARRAPARTPPRRVAAALAAERPPRWPRCRLLGRPATASARTPGWSPGAHTTTGKPLLANDPHLAPPMPRSGTRWVCTAGPVTPPARSTSPASPSPACPGVVIGHNADRLGLHQPRARRDRPLPGEGQRRQLRVRRQAGAAGDPQETIKVAGGARRDDHRALDAARPARLRRLRRGRRRQPGRDRSARPPRRRLRRRAALDRADARAAPRTRSSARHGARTGPSSGPPQRSSTCRRRTWSTPTSTATSATRRPGGSRSARDGDGRLAGRGLGPPTYDWTGYIPFDAAAVAY